MRCIVYTTSSIQVRRLRTQTTKVTDKQRHALFAIKPGGGFEDEGWVNLHLLLWKYVT